MKKQLISLLCITAFAGSVFGMERSNFSAALTRAPRRVAPSAASAAGVTYATPTASSSSQTITIKSHDETKQWVVAVEVAQVSETLKDLIEEQSDLKEFHLSPLCPADCFDYLKALMESQYNKKSLFNELLTKKRDEIIKIVFAANYLDAQVILNESRNILDSQFEEILEDIDSLKTAIISGELSHLNNNSDLSGIVKYKLLENSNFVAAFMGYLQMHGQQPVTFDRSYPLADSNCDNSKTAQIDKGIITLSSTTRIDRRQAIKGSITLPKIGMHIDSSQVTPQQKATCFAWHPQNKNIIAYAKNDGVVEIFDIDKDVVLLQLSPNCFGTDSAVQSLAWLHDNNRLGILFKDGSKKSWQLNFDYINRLSLEQFLLIKLLSKSKENCKNTPYLIGDLSSDAKLADVFYAMPVDIVDSINRSMIVKLNCEKK